MKLNKTQHRFRGAGGMGRRSFLMATAAGVAAAGLTPLAAATKSLGAPDAAPELLDVIETVNGPVPFSEINWALAHEHLHGDFTGSNPPLWKALPEGYELPDYADTDWTVVTGAAINAVREVNAMGVNLIVDYSPAGVGRNVRMLREVSQRTGVHIIAPSGLYRTAWGIPPELAEFDSDEIAAQFTRELTVGTEGTGVRAGFMKLSVANDGPAPHDELVYRGAARAQNQTGSTIGIHAFTPSAFKASRAILMEEGLDPSRFIWAHAARDGTIDFEVFRPYAEEGTYISFDGITHGGRPSDEQLLTLIEQFTNAGLENKILLSADAVISAHPPVAQYGSDIRYPYRIFKPKLEDRFGEELSRKLLRDNVVEAYRRGHKVS